MSMLVHLFIYLFIIVFAEAQTKNKWRALTLAYQEEVDRLSKLRSGTDGSDANKSSDWPHFQAMQILSPKITKQGQSNLGELYLSEEDEPATIDASQSMKTRQVRPQLRSAKLYIKKIKLKKRPIGIFCSVCCQISKS